MKKILVMAHTISKLRFISDFGECEDCGKEFTSVGFGFKAKLEMADKFRTHKDKTVAAFSVVAKVLAAS
jgi:hypothetical protein